MDKYQLSRDDITQWKKHPVSEALLELLEEHIKALRDMLAYNDWQPDTIHSLYKIRGQMQALDEVRDIHQFLDEKLTKEVIENVEEDV